MQWKTKQNCSFKCQSDTCNVSETLIWDQIIIGVSDEDFQKNELKEEWTLQQLEDHGRRTETATLRAAALTDKLCQDFKKSRKILKEILKQKKLYAFKKGQFPLEIP